MKNSILGLLFVSAGALVVTGSSEPAFAGQKNPYTVFIGTNYAYGTLAGTYRSSNTLEYIGCYNYRAVGSIGSSTYGWCYARNASGTTRSCQTTDSAMLAGIRSINTSSYVEFSWNQDGATCGGLLVHNASNHL